MCATPGHTPHHLCFIVTDDSTPPAVFTGGSMLYGTVGRTDLLGGELTDHLTRDQFRSVRRLASGLPDDAHIYPTHGFGSFCASASSDQESDGTLRTERNINIALTATDEDAFVERLVSGLDAYPRYYAHMGPLNSSGANAVDLSAPAPVDPADVARRIHRGEWVVDLRPRRDFAATHLAGTFGIEMADAFSTYLAWLLPWGMPVTLLSDDQASITTDAQRQLVRVGIDRPAGAAHGNIDTWSPSVERRQFDVTDFAHLADVAPTSILDVRRHGEFAAHHIDGATNIPLHELLHRLDELTDQLTYVHCQSGYRASIAASILDRDGRDVVLIDDHFDNVTQSGLPLEKAL